MGKPDFSSSDQFMPPRSLTERLKAEANGHAPSIEITTASFMAERFAPDLPPLAADEAELSASPTTPPEASSTVGQAFASWPERAPWASRTLLTVLILIALVPSIAFAVLYWRGAISAPGFDAMAGTRGDRQTPPDVQPASLAGTGAPETVLPKGDIELPPIALTVASAIAAKAGEEAPFAIALDSADTLPPRSIITIRGLPEGTSFSAGRPYGETEWSLRPDEIGDLRLVLPLTASGQRALSVELVAADGRTISSAATRLEITADPRAAVVLRPGDTARIDELIAHGRKMVQVGYVAGARGYYKRAAEAGSAAAAFALGATYDPMFIEQIGAQGIKPDVAQARSWYERAKALGDKDAERQLAELDTEEALVAAAPVANGPAPTGVVVSGAAEPNRLAPGAAEPSTAGATNPEWVEISGTVNVRAAPTPQAQTIKVAEPGTRYQATARQGSWVQVTDPKTSEVGWVYDRYVATAEAPNQ
jgi:hypothetical protein